MVGNDVQRDETVIGVIAAFLRDAERMAELVAEYFQQLGSNPRYEQSSFPAAYLLKLGAVLRIREWEAAGVNDVIDASLPGFRDALADLDQRLETERDRLVRGEAPLLGRVLVNSWLYCAQPNTPFLGIDVVLQRVERSRWPISFF